MDILDALLAVASYFSGCVPAAVIIARRVKGIDIRHAGSGNPGAANVYRMVGPGAGYATLAADALKGYLPVFLAQAIFPESTGLHCICAGLAVTGHLHSVFQGFHGGKGVATAAGAFAALIPQAMFPTVLIFIAGVGLSGHISLGSIVGTAAMPFLMSAMHPPWPMTVLAWITAAVILFKHIPNIRHLMRKEEPDE